MTEEPDSEGTHSCGGDACHGMVVGSISIRIPSQRRVIAEESEACMCEPDIVSSSIAVCP